MNTPIIEVRDVVTVLGGNLIHDHVSCIVRQNEIYALLGGSGSGKSTLMREMILLEHPKSGTIRLLGHDLSTLSPLEAMQLRRSWGVLFQSGALYSSLTVGENIALLYNEYTDLTPKLIEELIHLKINLVGLPPHAKHLYPSQLSGGMVKRAALARAVALDPKLLFLDEPTSGLDPLSSRQFDELILQLRELLGLTIVMVTHDLDTIHHIVDRFTLLGDKKAIAEGSLEEVLAVDHPIVDYFFQKGQHGIAR
ncbi:ABC transporter related protein [Sulfuricurvum kujiense DSM 16994]|uniref:ABC transporter related protein n=1 Tax=Sulfuricurvum kujiense (strain ATCC BAA-921 / DSM 16994 / JCM 11577 / YK-1) TaxID=709032 RepID=E4U1R5_SULKY|nr:ATP-binding cassette domain-containing protein [Sulfuricurvum kujiense]ADR34538.1 ABC transporter related protein [Sulfuricurvum kujiense DSM 16994]